MDDDNMAIDRGAAPAFIIPSPLSSNVTGNFSSFPIVSAAEAPVVNFVGEQPTVPVVARPTPPQVRNYILRNKEDKAIEVPGDLAGLVRYFLDGQHIPASKKTRGRQSRLTAVYVKTGQMIVSTHIPISRKNLGKFTLDWIDQVCQTFGVIRPPLSESSRHMYLGQAETHANDNNAVDSLAARAAALNINDSEIVSRFKTSPTYTRWAKRLRKRYRQSDDEKKPEVGGGKVNNGRVVKTRQMRSRTKQKHDPKPDVMMGDLGDKGADGEDVAMDSQNDCMGQLDCGMAIDQTVPSPSKMDCRMADGH
ncbi:hypothetical protein IWX90DRAFT_189128 [Phyllosticta citrichinensis]|uniref:Uncharacterized protein n=1 Tax=Phyllosticta citrichinensis TaxID=1130410 RepID=A0ABR1XWH6_9PEZI